MSTLSPTAQAAIASIGGPRDLRLRTQCGPDTKVLTSWMPCDRRYESVVTAPDAVYAAMDALRLHSTSRYATRAEAIAGHRQVVTRVGMLLQTLKAQAS